MSRPKHVYPSGPRVRVDEKGASKQGRRCVRKKGCPCDERQGVHGTAHKDDCSPRPSSPAGADCSKKRKNLKAAFIVAALAAAVGVVEVVYDASLPFVGAMAQGASLMNEGAVSGEGSPIVSGQGTLPECFIEECFDGTFSYDTRISDDGRVIGFLSHEDPATLFDRCAAKMRENGWMSVSSLQENGGTFLKHAGTYRWAFIACTRIGEDTSIVVQVA